ncbi:MAG TPA: hypothetical protein VD886_06435 [Herpetosiphonaceae bacterium]|nr:hypothetical protein [Herpetosiphonaceae bacterium]
MLQVLLGLLCFPILMYLPGWAWSRAFHTPADWLGRQYERLVASALWTGWLAFGLAEVGALRLWLHLALTLLFCAAGWALGRRRAAAQMAPAPLAQLDETGRPRWETPLYVVVLGVFALLVARPFETVLGGRDAGVYPNTAYAIARTGGIVQTEPLLAEIAANRLSADPAVREPAAQAYTNLFAPQEKERYTATRMTQPGFFSTDEAVLEGKIYPQGFHLYPVWLAVWTLLFGAYGGLMATGYLGLLGAWSVAMVGRRVVAGRTGAVIGALALLLLCFSTLQIWFSRYTTAESGTQMLLWGGLAMWINLVRLDAVPGRSRAWYAALTGLAIGQLILIRIEFHWGVGPLALYLLATFVRRRWTRGDTVLALSLGAMLLHGIVHILTIARAYFLDTTWGKFQDYAIISRLAQPLYNPILQEIRTNNKKGHTIYASTPRLLVELALVGLAAGLIWALWRRPGFSRRVEALAERWRRPLLGLAVAGLLGLAAFAYFIRPQHLSLDAVLHPLDNRAAWASYIGAPLPIPFDQYPKQAQRAVVLGNMVRLGWYLSPLGIGLGVLGLAAWIWRDLNRRSWMVLAVGVFYGAFSILDTYGTAEQHYIYIARRFLAGAVPIFTLGAAWLLAAMLAARRRIWRGLALAGALAQLAFLVGTGWRAARHVEYAGAIDAVAALAERIEPNAIVLMRGGDRDTPTNIATPLRYAHNREVLVVYSPDPTPYRQQLAAQIASWQSAGRPVYLFLGSNGGIFDLPGFALEDRFLFDLPLPEWQQLQIQKPFTAGQIRFTYRMYALRPAQAPPADGPIALTDYRWQAGGFYPVEYDPPAAGAAPQAYAWTNGAARLLLPAHPRTATLTLDFRLGLLPPSLQGRPVEVCPTIQGLEKDAVATPLPCASLPAGDPASLSWDLPAAPGSTTMTLVSRQWSPNQYAAEYATPPNDARTLSIQWIGGQWENN